MKTLKRWIANIKEGWQQARKECVLERYQKLYESLNPYLEKYPEEAKALCIKFRWAAIKQDDPSLEWFANHIDGWLKENGHW